MNNAEMPSAKSDKEVMMQVADAKQQLLQTMDQKEYLSSCKVLRAAPSTPSLRHMPTASSLHMLEDCTDAGDSRSASSGASEASEPISEQGLEASRTRPRFLHCLELAQVNWARLAKDQEWRRVLKLRGLPSRLCDKYTLQAFLEAHGLSNDVLKVSVSSKDRARMGSAVLQATSGQGVAKLARFFHGRLLPGSRHPVSVQFANIQEEMQAGGSGLTEPIRVSIGSGVDVAPPPGLECMVGKTQACYVSAVSGFISKSCSEF